MDKLLSPSKEKDITKASLVLWRHGPHKAQFDLKMG